MTKKETNAVENTNVTENTNTSIVSVSTNTFDLSKEFEVSAAGTGPKIRTTTTSDDVTLFNAINSSAEKVEDYLDQTVEVASIVVTSADILIDINDTDPDGEKENKPVVHFFTTDGKHISSISNGIKRATENLLSVGFGPSEGAPIKITFKEVKTKKGTAHSFDLVSR